MLCEESRYAEARRNAHLTQRDACRRIGISARTLSDYETGKRIPNACVVKRMSQAYGCSTDAILGIRTLATA